MNNLVTIQKKKRPIKFELGVFIVNIGCKRKTDFSMTFKNITNQPLPWWCGSKEINIHENLRWLANFQVIICIYYYILCVYQRRGYYMDSGIHVLLCTDQFTSITTWPLKVVIKFTRTMVLNSNGLLLLFGKAEDNYTTWAILQATSLTGLYLIPIIFSHKCKYLKNSI